MPYVLEDDLHFDVTMCFPTVEAALAEIRWRAALPWDHEDNEPPCWEAQNCARQYCIYECRERECPHPDFPGRKVHVCTISAAGLVWENGFEAELAQWQAA